MRYFRVAQKERALFGLENKSKFTFLGRKLSLKTLSLLELLLVSCVFLENTKTDFFVSSSSFLLFNFYFQALVHGKETQAHRPDE